MQVVAAENFWGSIAAQLGGTHAHVTKIISNPNTDPHDYEPTVQDARTVSTADLVVFNGVGYDPWMQRVLAASPSNRRVTLEVGQLVGVPLGGNPHRWYSPDDVQKVIDRTTADYKQLDPADSAYFDQQRQTFETVSLAKYKGLIAQIKSKYAGTAIGASESIIAPLAQALGLKMMTPASFLGAISEGTDPTAADKATVDAQIKSKQIEIFIYNRQNSTPDVIALVNEARAQGIPVVTVTETLEPATATFQDWQSAQLESIQQALSTATGR
jgi:zinc/manganese transport system substrate-binding protein